MAMLHFRPVDPRDLRCAYACAKMQDAGSRVGKHCVLAGFGGPPMAMLHFRPVDPRDLRCAYACAKM